MYYFHDSILIQYVVAAVVVDDTVVVDDADVFAAAVVNGTSDAAHVFRLGDGKSGTEVGDYYLS